MAIMLISALDKVIRYANDPNYYIYLDDFKDLLLITCIVTSFVILLLFSIVSSLFKTNRELRAYVDWTRQYLPRILSGEIKWPESKPKEQ